MDGQAPPSDRSGASLVRLPDLGESSQTVEHDALQSALRTLLRPLVRILLRNGVPFRAFMEHAKKVYVDVAMTELAVEGRKPSLSRASVLTGLTRKDVSRLAEADSGIDPSAEQAYNRAARVISGWVRDRKFHDARGRPASLPVDGKRRSFAALVRMHSGDMPVRAVLDELLRVGAVRELRDGRIQLVTRSYIPQQGEREKLGILGTDVAALISTIGHNLTHPPDEAFLQLKVAYDNIPEEAVEQLRRKSGQRAHDLLHSLDRTWSRKDRDANPAVKGSGRKRLMLGIYYHEEDYDETP